MSEKLASQATCSRPDFQALATRITSGTLAKPGRQRSNDKRRFSVPALASIRRHAARDAKSARHASRPSRVEDFEYARMPRLIAEWHLLKGFGLVLS